jgi:aconitate decarboxylase
VLKEKFRDLAGRILTADAVAKIEQIVSTLETHATPAAPLGAEVQKLK